MRVPWRRAKEVIPAGMEERLPIAETTVQRKRLSKKAGILLCVLCAGAIAVFWGFSQKNGGQEDTGMAAEYITAVAERGDITHALTGSATLEAANSYSVTTLAEGEILTADFEEGDIVTKDDVLYTLDSSDASSNIEKSEIALQQSQRSYNRILKNQDDLSIKASVAGTVVSVEVEKGDDVAAGQTVATIRNSSTMELTVPFAAADAKRFYIGQPATVTLDSTFETLTAEICEISAVDEVTTGNVIMRDVTFSVKNPGGLSTQAAASAAVNGVGSSKSGTFQYKDEAAITAEVSGTVSAVYLKSGDWANKDTVLVKLSSDTLTEEIQNASDSLRNAQLSLESQYEQLDAYTVKSPISGTVIDKNYKAGETTEANQVLCTIYDLSYLTMTMNIDELDISDVAVGQAVRITADAVEDTVYEGVVTKVSVAGTTSGGVTTYPVTIRIDQTDGLLPGMNADATIELESAENTLVIPSSALLRGNRVLITADSPSADMALEDTAPDGYVYVEVETGVSDDSQVEILSGLQEGDIVAYLKTSGTEDDMMPGGMMMPDSSMPSGGIPSGSMPSGGGPGGGMGGGF